ncbi:MAG: ABC transporter permease [SAR324 cluster bacterium]|nr:ABC transporter permease [SAR324 cluster bacterium]
MSNFFRLARKLRRAPVLPAVMLFFCAITALIPYVLMPHSPFDIVLSKQLVPPFWQQGGTFEHLLGTDQLGRDILSRIILGARYSLSVAFAALTLGGVVGLALGMISGYKGGWLDKVLMRVVDSTLAFPLILLAMILVVALRPSITTVIIAIAAIYWARFARVIRGETLSIKEREYVVLARVAGASSFRIMLKHIFPNVLNTWVVLLTLIVGQVIVITATLSFLGVGIPPPAPAWGNMLSEGRGYLTSAWWISFFPGVVITMVVLSFNLFGDWLRDALDPSLRQV